MCTSISFPETAMSLSGRCQIMSLFWFQVMQLVGFLFPFITIPVNLCSSLGQSVKWCHWCGDITVLKLCHGGIYVMKYNSTQNIFQLCKARCAKLSVRLHCIFLKRYFPVLFLCNYKILWKKICISRMMYYYLFLNLSLLVMSKMMKLDSLRFDRHSSWSVIHWEDRSQVRSQVHVPVFRISVLCPFLSAGPATTKLLAVEAFCLKNTVNSIWKQLFLKVFQWEVLFCFFRCFLNMAFAPLQCTLMLQVQSRSQFYSFIPFVPW